MPPRASPARYNRTTMKDLYEAIERLSARLSFHIESLAKRKSLAIHFSGYSVSPEDGVLIRLFHTLVHLPKGYAATFAPRPTAERTEDGSSAWHIDIRRNDGVVRGSWASGITVKKLGGEYALVYRDKAISSEDILRILSELERPGMSGMTLDIARIYSMHYGRMPFDLAAALEGITDVNQLDRIYDAVLDGIGQGAVERMILHGGKGGKDDASAAVKTAEAAQPQPAVKPAN